LSFRSGDVPTESFEQISGQGKVIISASQAFERARERDDIGHGIFTHNLVKGLEEGEADHDGDGYISVEELYKYISKNVKAETKGQQVPMKWGIDEKGEIVIAKSIKTLQKKRAEIESLSSRAKELQNQARLDEALDAWSKVLEIDPKNTQAPLGIKQVEQAKKEKRELDAKIDTLFDYYKQGSIPGTIYNKAFGILRNPYPSRNDQEEIFIKLVEDLLNYNLSVENFVLSWMRIERPERGNDTGTPEAMERQEEAAVEKSDLKQSKKTEIEERVKTQEQHEGQAGKTYLEQELVAPTKKDVSILSKSKKTTNIFVAAGVIVLVIAGIMIYKKINPPVLFPEIAYFTASPARIEQGSSSTLEWSTLNAKKAEIGTIGPVSLSGNQTVSPSETRSFTLTAKNEEGQSVERTLTVEVNVQTPTLLPVPSQMLFQEDFATLDPAWGAPSSNISVQDGKLTLQPELNNSFTALNQAHLFEDMDARVKIRVAKSDNPNYGGGLVFWAADYKDYYYLLVTGDGWFGVKRWTNGRVLDPVPWRQKSALKKGIGEWNQLRVVTKGKQATVYINDTEVVTLKGQPPKGGGFIGLTGNSPPDVQNKTVWEFSELRVMKP
jgi:tetratricopeptide (TPR) repeat protein